ncbi:unnamed protein product, partial [Symbiodinium sp. CCMP2456]
MARKDGGPPPIPLLYQGSRLGDQEFADAFSNLREYIVLEALDDESQPLGYAVGRVINTYPLDSNGAYIEIEYLGAENEFYRWYIDNVDKPGGLPSDFAHHLCRKAVSTCIRKEGRRTIHVQKWGPIDQRGADRLLRAWGYPGFVESSRAAGRKKRSAVEAHPSTSGKSKAQKPGAYLVDELELSSVEHMEEDTGAPAAKEHRRGQGPRRDATEQAARAGNVLDGLLAEGVKAGRSGTGAGPSQPEELSPLEAKLGVLREKLKEKTSPRKGTAAAALADKAQAAAALPRKKRRKSEAVDVVKGLSRVLKEKARGSRDPAEEESDSDDMADDDADFEEGGGGLSSKRRQLKKLAAERPGFLLSKGLANMKEQLGSLYGEDGGTEDPLSPVVNRYLLSVIHPNYPPKGQPEEMVREMRTLALSLDLVLRGRVDAAGDLMMQRFKSCCMHLRDGKGHFGHFLELLPDDLLGGGATMGETEFARSMAVRTAKADALLSKEARHFNESRNAAEEAKVTEQEPSSSSSHPGAFVEEAARQCRWWPASDVRDRAGEGGREGPGPDCVGKAEDTSAGLAGATEQAKARWVCDAYKLPFQHYEEDHMITEADGSLRVLKLVEWEKLLGFDDNYISEGIHPKYKGTDREIRGGQLLGSAFHVFVAMALLDELFFSYAHINALELQAVLNSVKWRLRPKLTLREQQVTPAMSRRYSIAVLAFLNFLCDSSMVIGQISQFDDAACAWLEFLYADGQRKGLASDGLAGIQHFLPRCIGRLRQSWKLLKVWQKVEPPMRVLPISPLILLGMAGLAARLGLQDVAAGLLACFDGMLRSGELYNLTMGDVTFYRQHAVLRLGLTKSGKRTGREEMVVINSLLAVTWLRRACRRRSPSEPLLRRGADHFRKCFKLFLQAFALEDLLLNVYSLRRGGSSIGNSQGGNVKEVHFHVGFEMWYQPFSELVGWYLSSVGFDDVKILEFTENAIQGFDSYSVPRDTAFLVAKQVGTSLGFTYRRLDSTSEWVAVRSSLASPEIKQSLSELPLCDKDSHLLFINSVDASRDASRAENLRHALCECRRGAAAGDALTFAHLQRWQKYLVPRTAARCRGAETGAPFRKHDAYAKKGRECYPIDLGTEDRFKALLEEANDQSKPLALRAARAYLDVCFFHPFDDANSRMARLVLDFILICEGVVLRTVDPVFLFGKSAKDGVGAVKLVEVVSKLLCRAGDGWHAELDDWE